jgi:hypothetical protein
LLIAVRLHINQINVLSKVFQISSLHTTNAGSSGS